MTQVANLTRQTVSDLLRVFYAPIWELMRLSQASAVERDLDPAQASFDPRSVGNREHTWHWCCNEPVVLMKLRTDLYELRLEVPYERRQQLAPQELLDSCKYVYSILGTLAHLINSRLAKEYMDYILFLDTHNTYYRGKILSTDQLTANFIRNLYRNQQFTLAVAMHLKARIDEALNFQRARL
jgi:hypothetical protein